MNPEWLRSILIYNPTTGDLVWKLRNADSFPGKPSYRSAVAGRWNKHRAGMVAGHIGKTGYRVLCIEKRTCQAHRIAWAVHFGVWPTHQIDHINHDRSDNRLSNLREVTASENSRNRSLPRNNKSGLIGVHFHKPSGLWHARIFHGGQRHHLGAFDSPESAGLARRAESERLGYHPNHGAST